MTESSGRSARPAPDAAFEWFARHFQVTVGSTPGSAAVDRDLSELVETEFGNRIPAGTQYVAPGGNDSNSGDSWATAKATISAAARYGTQGTVLVQAGTYAPFDFLSTDTGGTTFKKFIAVGGAVVVRVAGDDIGTATFVQGGNGNWTTALATSSHVTRILQLDKPDEYGRPTPLPKRASDAALADAGRGWFFDTQTKVLSVRMGDGNVEAAKATLRAVYGEPDGDTRILMSGVSAYLEGFTFEGVYLDAIYNDAPAQVFQKNTRYLYSDNHGIVSEGGYIWSQGVYVHRSLNDGFSYNKYNGIGGRGVEIDSRVELPGDQDTFGAPSIFNRNGSSFHTGTAGVRINGEYRDTSGPNIADVGGAKTWSVGSIVANSLSPPGARSSNILIQDAGTQAWIDTGRASGAATGLLSDASAQIFISNFQGTIGTDRDGTIALSQPHASQGEADNISGDGSDNRLFGLAGDDTLSGGPGNDSLDGGTGNDILDGGIGIDVMTGGAGNDAYSVDHPNDSTIENPGEGYDTVFSTVDHSLSPNIEELVLLGNARVGTGNAGANLIVGNALANSLVGGADADRLEGRAGDDVYYFDHPNDVAIENPGEGYDYVFSTVDHSLSPHVDVLVLAGSARNGVGNATPNRLVGNAGANSLDGGADADLLEGRAGDDAYYVDHPNDVAIENPGEGYDYVFSTVGYSLHPDVEVLVLAGEARSGVGNAGPNRVVGNDLANSLDGGADADQLEGRAGDDAYYLDHPGDAAIENPGEGYDYVFSTVDHSLSANVDVLVLAGGARIAIGNAGANRLVGNELANTLDGGAGADQLQGRAGDDVYYVDHPNDTAIEKPGEGYDYVLSTVDHSLSPNVEGLVLIGNAQIGAGNSDANVIVGNALANTLDGGDGADSLSGEAGNDIFQFSTALGAGNVDRVSDFTLGEDRIALARAVFSALFEGRLALGAFAVGSAATDDDDRILYDPATGELSYDADGSAAGGPVLFAQLSGGIALSGDDFLIF